MVQADNPVAVVEITAPLQAPLPSDASLTVLARVGTAR